MTLSMPECCSNFGNQCMISLREDGGGFYPSVVLLSDSNSTLFVSFDWRFTADERPLSPSWPVCVFCLRPVRFRLQSVLFCVWEACGSTSLSLRWPAAPLHSTASRPLPSNGECPWQRSQQTPPRLFSLHPSIRPKLRQSERRVTARITGVRPGGEPRRSGRRLGWCRCSLQQIGDGVNKFCIQRSSYWGKVWTKGKMVVSEVTMQSIHLQIVWLGGKFSGR